MGIRHPAHRKALLSTSIILLLVLTSVTGVAADSVPVAIDFGGGFFFPWDGDHRQIYGSGGDFSVGIAPRLPRGDAWITFEVGLVRSEGSEVTRDPTFEPPDETYWLVPIVVGLRANAFAFDPPSRIRLYLGVGVETVFTRWKRDGQDAHGTPTAGVVGDIRPEVDIGRSWSLWIRNRVSILADVRYRDSGIPDLNFSGNSVQLGASYRME